MGAAVRRVVGLGPRWVYDDDTQRAAGTGQRRPYA
eukprot:gene15628-6354_t